DQVLSAKPDLTESELSRLEFYPKRGIAKARFPSWEVQLDSVTGEVLSSAPRRTSWLISLHESFLLGKWGRYAIGVPTALFMLWILGSGIYLYFYRRWQ